MDPLTDSFLTFKQGLARIVRRIINNPVELEGITKRNNCCSYQVLLK